MQIYVNALYTCTILSLRKTFPLAFISEDFGGACPSPGLNGLLSPTQFLDIFFICVLKNSNFFTYMYIGYILFFRAFLVALQETMTTPRTLEEGLDGRDFMFWMCISLIFFSNKMKNKNRSVF